MVIDYTTAPNILGYQKGALILGTTHIPRGTTIRVRALRGLGFRVWGFRVLGFRVLGFRGVGSRDPQGLLLYQKRRFVLR